MSYEDEVIEGRAVQVVPQEQAVALTDESRAIFERLSVVRSVLAPDLTMNELQLFALVAHRSGLDPFARQIYAVKRQGKMGIQTGIDGYRSIAARTGEYDGQDEPVYGPSCPCERHPQPHPEYATVAVYRKGMSRPVKATAYWHEYVPDPGPSGRGDSMWRKMPHVMIAKVAEALALRKAFPWDPTRNVGIGSDIYTTEEMAQADAPVQVSVTDRVSARAEAVRSGLTLREFAEMVGEYDPREVLAVRNEMFTDGRTVHELGDDERRALYDRLSRGPLEEGSEDEADGVEDGLPSGAGAAATEDPAPEVAPVVEMPTEAPRRSRPRRSDPEAMVACEVPSPFSDAVVCLLPKGHIGAHRAGSSESW